MSERPPLLGPLSLNPYAWDCGYQAHPGAPTCATDAVWHGIVLGDVNESGIAGMMSCGPHKAAMALTAEYIHPLDSTCGLPDARFVAAENRCVIPEDYTGRILVAEAACEG